MGQPERVVPWQFHLYKPVGIALRKPWIVIFASAGMTAVIQATPGGGAARKPCDIEITKARRSEPLLSKNLAPEVGLEPTTP